MTTSEHRTQSIDDYANDCAGLTDEARKLNGLMLAVWACSKPQPDVSVGTLRDLLSQCLPHIRRAALERAEAERAPCVRKLLPLEATDDMEIAAENDYEQAQSHFPDWKRAYRVMVAAAVGASPEPLYNRQYEGMDGVDYDAPAAAPASVQPVLASLSDDLWYLQDTRSFIGNDVTWWALGGNGYTTDLRRAQTYSREDAFRQAASRGCDRAWPKAYIDSKSRPAVDFQHIDHDAALASSTPTKGGQTS